MAVEFKILKFQVEPFTLKQIMQFNSNREYFLIANSVLSLNELYVLFYPFEQANMQSVPDGAFAIYQGGYYEPTKVPANAISVYNLSGVNTINGFILYI